MRRLAIFLITAGLQAATYYVSSAGNDSNPGTQARPWLTIQGSVSQMHCGDTLIVVANGVYVSGDANLPYFPNCGATTTIQSSNWNLFTPAGYRTNPTLDNANYGKIQVKFQGIVATEEGHGAAAGYNWNAVNGGSLYSCSPASYNGGVFTYTSGTCGSNAMSGLTNGSTVIFSLYASDAILDIPSPLILGRQYFVVNCSNCSSLGGSFQVSATPGGPPITRITCNSGQACGSNGWRFFMEDPLQVTVGSATITSPDAFVSWQNGTPVAFTAAGQQIIGSLPSPLQTDTAYYIVNLNRSTRTFSVATTPGGTPIVLNSLGTVALAATSTTMPNNWTFRGLEFTDTPTSPQTIYGFLVLGNGGESSAVIGMPHHFEVDHCYIHEFAPGEGNPPLRGIAENGTFAYIHDSYIAGMHNGEAQALSGWGSPGPTAVVNNFMEASGENILYGGNPAASGTADANKLFQGNYFYKPPFWKITVNSTGAASQNFQSGADVASGTTVSFTYSANSPPVVGQQSFVACASYGSAGTLSASDNQGNTYSQIGSGITSGALQLHAFLANVTTSSGAFTVTCTSSVSNQITITAIALYQISSTPDGPIQTASGTGSSISTASVTTTSYNDLVFFITAGTPGGGGAYPNCGGFCFVYSDDNTTTNVQEALYFTTQGITGRVAMNTTGSGGSWVAMGFALRGVPEPPNGSCLYDTYDPKYPGGEWYLDPSGQWYQCTSNLTWAATSSTPYLCGTLATCGSPLFKDMTEHKNDRFVLYYGNLYNNVWTQAQQGEVFNNASEVNSGAGASNDHITLMNNAMYNAYWFNERQSYCGISARLAPCIYPPTNHVMYNNLVVLNPESCGVGSSSGPLGCGYSPYQGGWGTFGGLHTIPLQSDYQAHNTLFAPDTGFKAQIFVMRMNSPAVFGACFYSPVINLEVMKNNLSVGDFNGDCTGPGTTIGSYFSNSLFSNNALKTATSTAYPASLVNPGGVLNNKWQNTAYPAANANIGWVNATGTIAGDYHLAATSPYSAKNPSATLLSDDGTDLGADIDLVNMATSGAAAGTPPWDAQSGLAIAAGSTKAVFHFQALSTLPWTVTIYSAPVRINANQVTQALSTAPGSVRNGTETWIPLAGLTASKQYWYSVTDGTKIMVGTFWTKAAGTGTYQFPFAFVAPQVMEYCTDAAMSMGCISLSSSTNPVVPVATNTIIYASVLSGSTPIAVQALVTP